jgi:hypothetical protein
MGSLAHPISLTETGWSLMLEDDATTPDSAEDSIVRVRRLVETTDA